MAGIVVHFPAGLLSAEPHDKLYLVGSVSEGLEVYLEGLASQRDETPPGSHIVGRVCVGHGKLRPSAEAWEENEFMTRDSSHAEVAEAESRESPVWIELSRGAECQLPVVR